MAWTVRNPRFEVKEYKEGWYWRLVNEGKGIAQSYGHPDKNDTVDFIRWLKHNGASVPIIGGGILTLVTQSLSSVAASNRGTTCLGGPVDCCGGLEMRF